MVQDAKLGDRSAMSHNIQGLLSSKTKYNKDLQVQPASGLTCQMNGRFLRLMMAKIKARVFHVASEPRAESSSDRLPA
jgi:hypothetical protein